METLVDTRVPWWLVLLQGIAALVIGVLLITEPSLTLLSFVVFLGVYWLVSGIFELVGLFIDRTLWGWKLLTGVLGVIAGIIIVRDPLWSTVIVVGTLVWVLAFLGIAIGLLQIARAIMGGGWGVGILGVISLAIGVLLLFRPLVSLAVLVGIGAGIAIVGGILAIAGAFWLRSAERTDAAETSRSRMPTT
jgi:uncharacterized membrane protein HdeD (DUF308 family)